jgi:hypothetical protein
MIPASRKHEQRGKMLGHASHPSTRIVSKRLLCLRTVILACLGLLLFAAAASAETGVESPPPGASVSAPEAHGSEPPAGEKAPVPPVEPAPVPPVVEHTPVPPVEPAPVPPVVEHTPVPPVEPTPVPPPGEPVAPGPGAVTEPTPQTPGHGAVEEKQPSREKATETAATVAGVPSSPSPGAGAGPPVAVASVPPGPVLTPPTGSEIVEIGARQTSPPESSELALAAGRGRGAGRPGAKHCELSGLGGPRIGGCAGAWLGAGAPLAHAPSELATIGTVSATLGGGGSAGTGGGNSGGKGSGGSSGGGRPALPTPGPAPSGASGAAAPGGSGVGLSGFLMLTVLLLAAPRAMRRLRLSFQPWLTAFFVLIPERPG